MKGKWKVTMNPMSPDKKYGVCRIKDINKVEHSGNREYSENWYENRKDAEREAEMRNKEER